MNLYRIHGDNIVECERIADLILNTLTPEEVHTYLVSPSTTAIEFNAAFAGTPIHWKLELFPGFNKKKRHWEGNIFDALKEAGSFFDETPDTIISKVTNDKENILLSIEFCSAVQAGNQAWQRSARAFSTGRTGCPYLYIIDFVKYELNAKTRARKKLRFPNAAVPYSYINYSKSTGSFIAQLYTKSEEFDKAHDKYIANFDESDFGNDVLGPYIVKRMLGMSTSKEEEIILKKNMNMVQFLANHFDSNVNFTPEDWQEVYSLQNENIVDYAVKKRRFGFHKTIAAKSRHGASANVISLVDRLSVGLASQDLPFGIIPADKRKIFASQLSKLYPDADPKIIRNLGRNDKHLLIAILKGFKPRGDDNRPDRGLLPFAAMLSSTDVDVMTYIYGPMIDKNLKLLDTDPIKLADKNGLWKSILSLSNYVALDVPVLAHKKYDAERIYDTSKIKAYYANSGTDQHLSAKPAFSCVPVNFGEDDVDTGILYLFTYILKKYCFNGMCNPPGGDWSSFSVIDGDYENRWLSLPRVSKIIKGKRPDHILELFAVFDRPLLLSIESKENSAALEPNVGVSLVTYIEKLMEYVPSAKRQIRPFLGEWQWGNRKINFHNFKTISAAAYLKKHAEPPSVVFRKKCEILFVMDPIVQDDKARWDIEIITSTDCGSIVKDFIIEKYAASGDQQFIIH